MNKAIINHIGEWAIAEKWIKSTEELTEKVIVERFLMNEPAIHRKHLNNHSWYNRVEKVVNVNGMYIQYVELETAGDNKLPQRWESGSIIEVKPIEKIITITEFVPK